MVKKSSNMDGLRNMQIVCITAVLGGEIKIMVLNLDKEDYNY